MSQQPFATKAVVWLEEEQQSVALLKRLSVLFDEIHFIWPTLPVIRGDVLSDRSRCRRDKDGRLVLDKFNFFGDTIPGLRQIIGRKVPELGEVVDALRGRGILKEVEDCPGPPDEGFNNIRNCIMSLDGRDAEFNRLSGTDPSEYKGTPRVFRLGLRSESEVDKDHELFVIDPPTAIEDSYVLSTAIHAAREIGGFPVFHDQRHRTEMAYRYEQCKAGLAKLRTEHRSLIEEMDFSSRFGEVSFSLMNSLVSPEAVSRLSLEDLLRYRETLDDARKRFVSADLGELASLIEENPWGAKTRSDIEKYVQGKLKAGMAEYEAQTKCFWERMFGTVVSSAIAAAPFPAIGSAAGAIVGDLIPSTSAWGMVLIGAAAGLAKEGPKLARELLNSALEERKRRRNGIAYLANLPLGKAT